MSVGVVMLVHISLDRAAQVARHWASHGCPVVLHVDKRVKTQDFTKLRDNLSDLENVKFSNRITCEWGTWSLVQATQIASELMLESFPSVRHVCLASGSCLPLRPVEEFREYLAARPNTNFIESVTTEDVRWTVGGLNEERFKFFFPFSWKKNRYAFDRLVEIQRRLKISRRIPDDITPHMGSQWWCLSRQTLSAILTDPRRGEYEGYFRTVWIPDESYFQTLVRKYSDTIESRSLTLSKFDFQGKPHVFYDDHLQLLRRSDCFIARKIWPNADRLYRTFLDNTKNPMKGAEPNPSKIDRIFTRAGERRTSGRDGLYMQSRMPTHGHGLGKTSSPYSIFEGFSDVFEDFENWLTRITGARVHGHLFGEKKVEFQGGQHFFSGGLSDDVKIRDYNARGFLTTLIWNTRGERQCFMYSPRDNQDINWLIALDANAQVSVITGAWAVSLFKSNMDFKDIRKEAARLQKIEMAQLEILRSQHIKARVRIWTLSDFIENPMEPLQAIIDEIGPRSVRRLTEAPKLRDLTGFGKFLQTLKNQGMHPYTTGDFSPDTDIDPRPPQRKRPYLVK